MKKLPVVSPLRGLIAAALVLVPVSLVGQNARSAPCQSEPMPKPPKLPIVTKHVLPGEGWGQLMDKWIVHRAFPLFDKWQGTRKKIATVGRGVTVTILDGINVVRQPDTIVATSNITGFGIASGEKFFRYTQYGEGEADVWAKDCWYRHWDGSDITEPDGTGCRGPGCVARVVRYGKSEWWFRLRTPDGRIGWTNAVDSLNPNAVK